MSDLRQEIQEAQDAATAEAQTDVNVILIQLESFIDPEQIEGLTLSRDAVPNWRALKENGSTGILTVPVVGAGTANTECEVLTGMSTRLFGPGEYPYETCLQDQTVESIAYILKEKGYATHAIHNHEATFYNRDRVYPNLGFDDFTSLEYMPAVETTPQNWAKDAVLESQILKALDATPDQRDFVFTVTVQDHGKYPDQQVLEDPAITVTNCPDPERRWAAEYYVNQLYETDAFIGRLVEDLEQREEKTILVLYGDHQPALGLEGSDMAGDSLFYTEYILWNNFGLEQREENLTSYQLSAYVLNPSSDAYDLRRITAEYAGADIPDGESAVFAAYLPAVFAKMNAAVEENGQKRLLDEIELPLAEVLASMEREGFLVDAKGIEEFGKTLQERIEKLVADIYELAGYEFNLNSPKQLGEALFERMGLPAKKKTKSGYSTNAEVLEGLAQDYPVVAMILEYRTLAKLKSTYCDGLLKAIAPDGRIHSTLNQTETRTGRISSTEPNLQNIPVRSELGKEMRKFFIAKEGSLLVDADYSQIELRVLAHVANDKNMLDAFNNGDDIHAITASQVFNMPLMMVTPLMRSRAKAVNFGIVYGIGAFSLAKDIGVTRAEADSYIKGYLAHFSGVDRYMKEVIEKAKENGYVETVFARRRYLPELRSSNGMMRAFGERVARNMPIQGTAADIIKIAMIRVYRELKKAVLRRKTDNAGAR